jgi:large subunit ribosomal protein L23
MNTERLYQVLKGPHVSEKAALGEDQVVFKVAGDASKLEVKNAVEKLFKVKVERVQTLNVKGKVKRNKFGLAKRPSWKKAIVRLAEGQEIDFSVVD